MWTLRRAIRYAEDEGIIIGFAIDYAEPGYALEQGQKGVYLGNWNNIDKWNPETKRRDLVSNFPSRLGVLLEKAGYSIEWLDEWEVCCDCNRAFRTQPDSHDWEMYGRYDDAEGDFLCGDCAKGESSDETL